MNNVITELLQADDLIFSPPKFNSRTLTNGIKVQSYVKHHLPLVQFSLMLKGGNKYDLRSKQGTAYLLAKLIDEGAGDYDNYQLSDMIGKLGASISVDCGNENINFNLLTLSENFEKVFDLLLLILTKPRFSDEDFEREKKSLLIFQNQIKKYPDFIASRLIPLFIFDESNPYSNSSFGFSNTVETISKSDVVEHYNKFLSSKNIAINIVGSFDEANVLSLFEKRFESLPKFTPIPQYDYAYSEMIGKQVVVIDNKNALQSEIRIAHSFPKRNLKNIFSNSILNLIFGGDFSSRLNQNLREEKGLTYGIGSQIVNYLEASYFNAATSVSTDESFNAVNEILNEMQKIKIDITEKEITDAKQKIKRNFAMSFETLGDAINLLKNKTYFDLEDNFYDNYTASLDLVTYDEVKKNANENLKPDDCLIIIAGDKEKILAQFSNSEYKNIVISDVEGNIIQ